MRLKNKTALITGGNSGIGLATARRFLAEGARVVITGRNSETLALAAAELGSDVLTIQADLNDITALEGVIQTAVEALGPIDILFANAGIGGVTPVAQTSLEAFEGILRTNLTSVFFTIQAALPHLNQGASIILNGSVIAKLGTPGWGAYAASKGAIRSLTRVLAAELAPQGIRVNQVTPGATQTPIWSGLAPDQASRQALDQRLSLSIPNGRLGEAEEVANVALFLASDEALHITAAEITVDGGSTGAPMGAPVYRA